MSADEAPVSPGDTARVLRAARAAVRFAARFETVLERADDRFGEGVREAAAACAAFDREALGRGFDAAGAVLVSAARSAARPRFDFVRGRALLAAAAIVAALALAALGR